MEQKKLNEIIKSHEEWANSGGKKGSRADLSGADLRRADLCGAILCDADFHGADLRRANLRGANLYGANLCGAILCDADLCRAHLRKAYFREANLCRANLYGAILPEGIYVAGGAGSEQRYTYYDAVNDHIICGCWDDADGNHLDSFKKRIEDVYGPDGKDPNPAHYKAYQAAIQYFEACREAYKEEI